MSVGRDLSYSFLTISNQDLVESMFPPLSLVSRCPLCMCVSVSTLTLIPMIVDPRGVVGFLFLQDPFSKEPGTRLKIVFV